MLKSDIGSAKSVTQYGYQRTPFFTIVNFDVVLCIKLILYVTRDNFWTQSEELAIPGS